MTKLKNVHTEAKVETPQVETPQAETPQAETPKQNPVFDEVEGMDQNTALSVLIQTAELAQKAGVLTMRDSVILAKAISLFAPGKI